MKQRIFILAATGQIGRPLVAQLVTLPNVELTALTRDQKRTSDLQQFGVHIITGDVNDNQLLENLFDNVDKVFLNLSFTPDMVKQQCKIIDACKRANVRHIVHISSMGAGRVSPSPLSKLLINRWHR